MIWVAIFVPETRGVAVGKEMDRLFGVSAYGSYLVEGIEETLDAEATETTSLLEQNKDRETREHRRTSLVSYT